MSSNQREGLKGNARLQTMSFRNGGGQGNKTFLINMAEAIPNSLDLFEKSAVQSAITEAQWIEIRLNSIEETAPVSFRIDGSSEDFIDLSETYLKVN